MEKYYNLFTVTWTTCYPTVAGCPTTEDHDALEELRSVIRRIRKHENRSSALEILETDRHGSLTEGSKAHVSRVREQLA